MLHLVRNNRIFTGKNQIVLCQKLFANGVIAIGRPGCRSRRCLGCRCGHLNHSLCYRNYIAIGHWNHRQETVVALAPAGGAASEVGLTNFTEPFMLFWTELQRWGIDTIHFFPELLFHPLSFLLIIF